VHGVLEVGRAFQNCERAEERVLDAIKPTKVAELTSEVKSYVEEAVRKDPNVPDHILSDED